MDIQIDLSKLDTFQENLNKLSENRVFDQNDLFPDNWMSEHTKSATWDKFVQNAPFDGEFFDDKLSNEVRDEYVANFSSFENWDDMVQNAQLDAVQRALFQGL